MKASLILMISKRMDTNKKRSRHEDKLIRMGVKARETLGLENEKTVELWPDGSIEDRIYRNRVLRIFKAYSADLKEAKEKVPPEDFNRIGFVTTKTFNSICRNAQYDKEQIWISDTIEDTVIGADPEFLLVTDNDEVQYAGELDSFDFGDTLGSDGPWAEIRPKPDIKVYNFVKNISDILNFHKNTEIIKDFKWLGGCYYRKKVIGRDYRDLPIGGHIHLGTPEKLATKMYDECCLDDIMVFSCLVKILDEYIAIPLMKLDRIDLSTKRRSLYGGYGDFRTDHGRLEYRSLSGEWLTYPIITKAVLGSAKAVAHEYFKVLDESDYDESLIKKPKYLRARLFSNTLFSIQFDGWQDIEITKMFNATLSSGRLHDILNEGNIKFSKSYFNTLINKFRSLSVYNQYSEYIDLFLQLVQMPMNKLNKRNKNLKHTWVDGEEFIIE